MMKNIYHFFLLLAVLPLSSCEIISMGGKVHEDHYYYCLNISICDSKGNDLVGKLKEEQWLFRENQPYWLGDISPDSYNLDILFSNFPPNYYSEAKPYYFIAKYNRDYSLVSLFGSDYTEGEGKWYLMQDFPCVLPVFVTNEKAEHISQNPVQDHIKYQISCPTIFGDDSVREIVAYWQEAHDGTDQYKIGSRFPECIRVEFEGNSYTPVKVNMISSEVLDYQQKKGLKNNKYYHYFVDLVLTQ